MGGSLVNKTFMGGSSVINEILGGSLVSVYMLQSTCTSITVLQYVCVVGWWMLDSSSDTVSAAYMRASHRSRAWGT